MKGVREIDTRKKTGLESVKTEREEKKNGRSVSILNLNFMNELILIC